ncbi:hypothetical protein BD410DRAFT_775512 [Rickenella mellea]|uniref:DUF6533 domain-containing protein n=1 Tax=Rickenella mellea TaxID=50990 RepID=A0A4Y7PS69_9AGAM|nr:hypothetical protein BD410DRAFT_775512 [Rickenella mellea]
MNISFHSLSQFNIYTVVSGTGKSTVILANATYILTKVEALVFYDYALTFSTEVSETWNSKFSGAQALFFLTRYSYMLFTALLCAIIFLQNPSETRCRVLTFNATVWVITTPIGFYGILTLRTYALYQKNTFILVILGVLGAANVSLAVYIGVAEKPEVGSTVYGTICGKPEIPTVDRVQLASTIISLIFGVLVFTLTFAKTIRHAVEMRKVGLGKSLAYFILRDGTLYFLANLLFQVVNAAVYFIPASWSIGNWLGVAISFSNTLTVILTNRLVLNLRRVSHRREGNALTIGEIGTIHVPAFAISSLIGNLGAPLRVGPEDDSEIEEIGVDYEAVATEDCGIAHHSNNVEELRGLSDN